jgi:NAD(P)-dependent dehydrogenase (short-subunit alcohol dehydrogenase family)
MLSFKGKNIIVTGATGDLGTAITQRLISQGANVLAVGSSRGVPAPCGRMLRSWPS